MAKNFETNIVIGGKINPSLQKAFANAGEYASKAAGIIEKTNSSISNSAEILGNKISSVGNIAKTISVVGGALSGAAILGGKAMLDQAANLEQYKNTLNVVMKDQQKAGEIFAWAVDFANKTPFETDEIVEATVKLQSYGVEAQKTLPIIGDMASAMGKSMDQAVEAIADAQTGELERLKEFGITKNMIIEQANKKMQGIEIVNNKGQITNQQKFNEALMSLMEDRYKGSMDIQSKSWKGIMSNIQGTISSGLATIAGISKNGEIIPNSAFDIAKQKVSQLADKFSELQESGKFEELQKQLSNLASNGLKKVEEIVPKVIEFGQKVIDNGPQIISTIDKIAIGFIGWKALSGIASAIQTIGVLSKALGTLKNQYILLSIAKSKDKIETLYLMGLYAKDAVAMGIKTAATWAQTTATSALSAAHGFLTGTLIPGTIAIVSGTASFIANTAAKVANAVATGTMTAATWAQTTASAALSTAYAFLTGTLIPGTIAIISGTASFVANTAAKIANAVATTAMTVATGAWNVICGIATGLTWAFGAAIAFLTSPIGLVIVAIVALIGIVYLLYQNWETISASLVSVWQNNVVPFFQGIASWFNQVFEGIGSGFKGVVNWVIGGLNKMIDAVNSLNIKVPDWVPLVGGRELGFSIAKIPAFAKGGIATGPSIFGEAGPEMAIPLKYKHPRSIALLQKAAQMIGFTNGEASTGNTSTISEKTPFKSIDLLKKVTQMMGLSREEKSKDTSNILDIKVPNILDAPAPLEAKKPRSISLFNKKAEKPEGSPSGGGGNTFIYSPQINSNNPQETKQLLEDDYEKWKAYIERYFQEEDRVRFDG
ncbi:tape measure protein [Clostridium intestinale]|uniref:tape measure protein n=1 Tax=Clostridium intestinale TaxID=36845 RepID=UPI002DD622EA|nr:tape measure protein [Clostridium intestinale]WRY53926.1 tape measure protein [Clostridium intestinale]